MRRAIRIAVCLLCVIAGTYVAAATKIWPLVWTVGFPLAYIGILKTVKTIIKHYEQKN